jgi:hypothetical protein
MSAKAEIGWRRTDEQGERWQVYARHVGSDWRFFIRQRRYDQWEPVPNPPLVDWLQLLEALERRMPRHRSPPAEVARVRQRIRELFPNAPVDP